MRNSIFKLFSLFVSLLLTTSLFAQAPRTVTGIVTDSSGEALIGANVIEKGTTNGVITDINGAYKLDVRNNAVLEFSYIGYEKKEIKVGTSNTIDVTLSDDSQTLDDVVVVGYGVQRKITTTGAVSKVEGDVLNRMTVTDTKKALHGLTPGITVVDRGGAPGGDDTDIYLRGVGTTGNNKPLVLVDGIEMALQDVPATEVESISVLKDAASASIYGSRAAHGVILVTTKRGQEGKMKVSYDGYIGFQDRATKPELVSARDYMEMVNEAQSNSGRQLMYTEDDILATLRGEKPYINYLDEVYKTAYVTEHTVKLTGGNESSKYMASFNYLDQPGLTANTEFKRYNFRMNADIKVNNYVKFSSDISYRHNERLWPEGLGDAQYHAWTMNPTTPIRYENGNYALSQNRNAVAITDLNVVGRDDYMADALVGQLKLDIEPVKDLILTGAVSLNALWDRRKIHKKNYKFYDGDDNYVTQRNAQNGVSDARNNRYELTLRFLANYKKKIAEDHDLAFLYGMEQKSYRNYYSKAERRNLISDDLPDVDLGSASNQYANGNPSLWGINSFFGRINYGYKDRYLFEANIRADGSSRFAKGHKWGVFPSFSAAWRISEEAFMREVTFVDNLKLRASWGQTGNERIDAFLYLPQYATEDIVMNGELETGVIQKKMANPDVTWETVEVTNFGLDFSFLNNMIYGEVDIYRKDTKDILLFLKIPQFIGLEAPPQNAGVVRNSGIETMLGFRKKLGKVNLNTSVNFSYNKNKWVDRGTDNKSEGDRIIQQVGSPLNAFYMYKADGLFANEKELEEYKAVITSDQRGLSTLKPGDVRLVDMNGDGIIDDKDKVAFRSDIPKFIYSWNVNLDYKGFDLNMMFQGTAGGMKYFYGEWVEGASYQVFTGKHFLDRWTPENENGNAKIPRLESANNRNQNPNNSFFLKSTSYLRLKNVQLGYTIPKTVTQKWGVDKLRVYVAGSNLLTFSNLYQGMDPEVGSGRPNTFPPLKIINFGVNLVF